MVRRAALLVVVAVCFHCSGSSDRKQVSGTPEEALGRFFDAVERADCEGVFASLGGALLQKLRDKGCDHTMRELQGLRLESIEGSTRDGRAPDARLVRTRLRGVEGDVIIRVEPADGRWVITSL